MSIISNKVNIRDINKFEIGLIILLNFKGILFSERRLKVLSRLEGKILYIN